MKSAVEEEEYDKSEQSKDQQQQQQQQYERRSSSNGSSSPTPVAAEDSPPPDSERASAQAAAKFTGLGLPGLSGDLGGTTAAPTKGLEMFLFQRARALQQANPALKALVDLQGNKKMPLS